MKLLPALFCIACNIFVLHCIVTAAQIAAQGYCELFGIPHLMFFPGAWSVQMLFLLSLGWFVVVTILYILKDLWRP